jgi:hypothetical protein
MSEKGFYHPSLGYWQTITGSVGLSSYPEGTIEVPLKPAEFFEWQGSSWVKNQEEEKSTTAKRVRAKRDYFLRKLDKVVSNPLRWSEMTDEQKQAIAAYRQNLLNVPQQASFPLNVSWPTSPI